MAMTWKTAVIITAWAGLLLTFAAYIVNPIREAEQHIGAPVAGVLGLVHERCPSGWKDVSSRDEHTLVRSCERGGWLVVLGQDGRFEYGFQVDTPGAVFIFDETQVPQWPSS